MCETSAGIVVFRFKENVEFLLMQRSDNNMWDFPKGHYKNSEESAISVALRELGEETQIKDLKVFKNFFHEYDFINPKGSHRRIILFLGETQSDPVLSNEHKTYKWVNFLKACELLEFEEKIDLLKKVKSFLITHNYTF